MVEKTSKKLIIMPPVFDPVNMRNKYGTAAAYVSPQLTPLALPTLRIILETVKGPLLWLRKMAIQNRCDDIAWVYGSAWFGDIFESIGGKILIEGLQNIRGLSEPAVFVANHMSTLETFMLPAIIRPCMPVTFVVKRSLTQLPVFGPVMRSRNPIAIARVNPREDLAVVLGEGVKRLQAGISVIVFPQHSRMANFNREQFNTIGVKLARKANVPVVPLALKTDACENGRIIKELGRVRPSIPVHFKFAEPVRIAGNGKAEHAVICDFIEHTVNEWRKNEGGTR